MLFTKYLLGVVKRIQLVSFEYPEAPFYGGTIVVTSTIEALLELGVKVVLHAYYTGAKPVITQRAGLKVYLYKRSRNPLDLLSPKPYIIQSRRSKKLVSNALQEAAPIIIDGLHGFDVIQNLKGKIPIILRWHNIESNYYSGLADQSSGWQKVYFLAESRKLAKVEKHPILKDIHHLFINQSELSQLGFSNASYLPTFHLNSSCTNQFGYGLFGLFHAKLSVPDNEQAAMQIIHQWPMNSMCLVIAGMNPSKRLIQLVREKGHKLFSNPSEEIMRCVQEAAHVHVLWSSQKDGVKLKLLNSLFRGRWVLGNMNAEDPLLANSQIAFEMPQLGSIVKDLAKKPFGVEEQKQRRTVFQKFSNEQNAKNLLAIMNHWFT